MNNVISIAIDGPAGAGKSTISKMLAQKLGFAHIDTGAIYRTIGLYAYQTGTDPKDAEAVAKLLISIKIEISFKDGKQKMLLGGIDVSEEIRRHEISAYASDVSAISAVRDYLLQMQRDIAAENNVIMDGRDIGTVVLPNADMKIFLTASAEDRAKRRYEELLGKGEQADYETILEDVRKRDYKDMNRPIAPLKPAADAIIVDTSGYPLERSVETLESIIRRHLKNAL